MRTNTRKYQRVLFVSNVHLTWEDSAGAPKFAIGKSIDISEGGLQVELLEAIPIGTRVNLNIQRIMLVGTTTVKHSARYGAKYKVHVELSQPLHEKTLAAIHELLGP
jgi:hypothetical protein